MRVECKAQRHRWIDNLSGGHNITGRGDQARAFVFVGFGHGLLLRLLADGYGLLVALSISLVEIHLFSDPLSFEPAKYAASSLCSISQPPHFTHELKDPSSFGGINLTNLPYVLLLKFTIILHRLGKDRVLDGQVRFRL